MTEDLNAVLLESGRFEVIIADGFLYGRVRIGGVWKQSESMLVPANQWFHLILLWDGNKIQIFKDNELAITPLNATGSLTGSGDLYLGGRAVNEPYEGMIDDLRIFDRALSASQRAEVFNFADPPLITYFGEEYSYAIETIKGPTEFNATGLPPGLEIDPINGLIFGEANATGNFSVTVTARNLSGEDNETIELTVNPGRQSIQLNEDPGLLVYGDPPVDLNLTATSGLPVSLEILEGNQSVDLNGTTLLIKDPGFVRLKASQPGNSNWLPAEAIVLNFQVMAKEATVRVQDQFRSSDQPNPFFTYVIDGLVADDNQSDFNVTVVSPVANGSALYPTPEGVYDLNASGAVSPRYLFSYLSGKLTVSDKLEQDIVFDQNLTEVNATTDALTLTGYSIRTDGNLTGLPISYEVDDPLIARILVTRDDALGAYWKLNEELYNGVKDEKESYSGTLVGLPSVGSGKVWQPGLFGNGLKLGHPGGRADLGSVQFDGNFSLSFWIRPESVEANASVLLSKEGISTMNLFRLEKADGNGSLRVFLYPDGSNEKLVLESNGSALQNQVWSQFCLSYNEDNSTLSFYRNGQLLDRNASVIFTGTPISQRFSSMQMGASGYSALALRSFNGMLDDLRLYDAPLSMVDSELIYGDGGGDFDRLRIIGAGQAKITARQAGDSSYAAALPVDNYITVVKVPQQVTFPSIADHAVGDFPFRLNAVASSGLPVSYLTSNPSLATVVGDYVYVKGAGPVTITAVQPGDERYLPALDVNQSFTITYGNLFSDSAPGLKLWFDATDVNGDQSPDESFDFINGDRVSMWVDKSGNTNHPIQAALKPDAPLDSSRLECKAHFVFRFQLQRNFQPAERGSVSFLCLSRSQTNFRRNFEGAWG